MLIEWIHCPICGGKTRNKIRGEYGVKELSSLLSKVKKRIFNRRKKVTSNRHKRARR